MKINKPDAFEAFKKEVGHDNPVIAAVEAWADAAEKAAGDEPVTTDHVAKAWNEVSNVHKSRDLILASAILIEFWEYGSAMLAYDLAVYINKQAKEFVGLTFPHLQLEAKCAFHAGACAALTAIGELIEGEMSKDELLKSIASLTILLAARGSAMAKALHEGATPEPEPGS